MDKRLSLEELLSGSDDSETMELYRMWASDREKALRKKRGKVLEMRSNRQDKGHGKAKPKRPERVKRNRKGFDADSREAGKIIYNPKVSKAVSDKTDLIIAKWDKELEKLKQQRLRLKRGRQS